MYLDIGTNIGIQVLNRINYRYLKDSINKSELTLQIRKLFEPTKYPSAPIHPIFNEYFHRNIKDLNSSLPYICAIGIEPNPNHEKTLNSKKFIKKRLKLV